MSPQEVIILAGGKGTRLAGSESGTPKCISRIGNTSFLHYVLSYFILQGVHRFIFSLGHFAQEIIDQVNRDFPDMAKTFVVEPEPLGTGGAIANALGSVEGNTVCVVNADTYFRVDLQHISAFHHMCGAECTIALKEMDDSSRYGRVTLNKDYSISGFEEKGIAGPGLINGGVYILNKRKFLGHDHGKVFSFEKDYLQRYLNNTKIYGVKQDAYFIDIGIPEDLAKAQQDIPGYAQ